jgi:hypothetical protein
VENCFTFSQVQIKGERKVFNSIVHQKITIILLLLKVLLDN